MLNPDVLYLQSTPMSEPLLFGTTFLAIALVARWAGELEPAGAVGANAPALRGGARAPTTTAPGWALVAACLTRYEAWPITAAAIGLAGAVLLRRGWRMLDAVRAVRGLALWPAWAIAAFLVNSKITVGAWFVSSGIFRRREPGVGSSLDGVATGLGTASCNSADRCCRGQPARRPALISGSSVVRAAGVAARSSLWPLAAAALLPWYAYLQGHPVRLRYDVPLVAACAVITGLGVQPAAAAVRALRAGIAIVAVAAWQANPFDATAGVIKESQRDAHNAVARRAVTAYLLAHWDRQPIMMSMGSLGHYMHDLSQSGFAIGDFLHEGNGEIWKYAVRRPRPYVEWIVVEERAEGGDELYRQGRLDPRFFEGYARVAEGGGVALYQRNPARPRPPSTRRPSEAETKSKVRRPAAEIQPDRRGIRRRAGPSLRLSASAPRRQGRSCRARPRTPPRIVGPAAVPSAI